MRDKRSKWLSGVGVVVLIGGLALANYGGGVTPAQAHDRHYHNPFKQIMSKLNEILDKLNGASSSSSGGVAGNYTMRWDTNNLTSRFTPAFTGAVLDKNTGLVWEQSPMGGTPTDWNTARLNCVNQNVGGTLGWRLPSVVELASLVDTSVTAGPVLPLNHPFSTNVQSANYWAATLVSPATGSSFAYTVDFSITPVHVGSSGRSTNFTNLYWCVRGPMNESAY